MFSHDISGGLFTSGPDALTKNPTNPEAKLYSILSQLEAFRLTDGSFHFKLCYPEEVQYYNHCNEWTQTTNPAIETSIFNFRAIKLPFPFGSYGENFKRLGFSPASSDYTFFLPNALEDWI